MMRGWLIAAALLSLAGCSKAENMARSTPEALSAFDVQQSKTEQPSGPQIAYSYTLGYRLGNGAIGKTQATHVAQCNALGPARCRVLNTDLSSSDAPGGSASGRAEFVIDARIARAFITKLDAATEDAGGVTADRKVEAEDVTKQVIDTDARVRAKQALADRLLTLIKSSNGKVGDLVEAEKAFADTQEALDSARSLQAELRQRVAMSRVSVDYSSTAETGTWAPIRRSLAGIGETLAGSVSALISFVVFALPWALLLSGLVWLMRRRGWRPRWPWRRREPPAA